ncbi:hypothetical protein NBRC110019_15840 [Neptunitalea chrysea]|uniref:Uncharacterized protein n=1 Tax=Neptunitalea chrysea TaxID=1647581 RepID=A0A9W6B7A1_9FLAO|nr:hypothetical protein [Neptunitalea chrysea]GLB52544.1 hypothetical protein NBRC110019_15840 [Neptunitalea chrysea]
MSEEEEAELHIIEPKKSKKETPFERKTILNTSKKWYSSIKETTFLSYTFILFIVSVLLISLYSLNTPSDFLRVSSSLIILTLASFFTGSIFGFLFGLPNYKAHNENSENNIVDHQYDKNPSLKEITSWLTKIIVGVSLVEIKSIIKYFSELIKDISFYISGDFQRHVLIVGALIIFFFILGFIVFFLITVTKIFEMLVKNDMNIKHLLNNTLMDSKEAHINNVLKNDDFKSFSVKQKNLILQYVSNNGLNKLDPFYTKRLAKFLYLQKEYDAAAKAFEIAYEKNSKDYYSFLNACFIRSRFLKQFSKSNKKLKEFTEKNPKFPPAFYNLSCNYNREYNELDNENKEDDYGKDLRLNAREYLKKALTLDRGLYSEALKDSALNGLDIKNILAEVTQ